MADTFAHGVRRRPQALQSPRPIAQACSVRSKGMTGLEAAASRLPTAPRVHPPPVRQAPPSEVAGHSPACPSRRCPERPLGDL